MTLHYSGRGRQQREREEREQEEKEGEKEPVVKMENSLRVLRRNSSQNSACLGCGQRTIVRLVMLLRYIIHGTMYHNIS